MKRRRVLQIGGVIVIALVAVALLLRACLGVFVNKEDEPVANSLIEALERYKAAKGIYPPKLDALVPEYLQALPVPREFGKVGYAPLDGGRGCLVGYFTHRDFLEEYDCGKKTWSSLEYDESRLVKAEGVQWLSRPR